jgi:hypothetical protein
MFSVHFDEESAVDKPMCSNAHKKYTKSFDSACLLAQFVTSKHESDDILAAECVFVFHVVKHSHSYRV